MKLIKKELLLTFVILFVGLFVRIYNLGSESFWLDEGFSIMLGKLSLSKIVEATSHDFHPPLYYVILHFWINLFGDSEFSSRFLSLIFGVLSIFMIYKVGSLIFNNNIGILSSLILALSAFHIQYSQELRMYSLMALLTLLSFYFCIRLLGKRGLIFSLCYIVFSIFLMYTHVSGLFIIIAQNIYLLTLFLLTNYERNLSFRRWIFLQGILVVLYAPWIRILITQISKYQSSSWWVPVPTIFSIISTFRSYSGSLILLSIFLLLSFFSIFIFRRIKGKVILKDLLKSIEGYSWSIGLSNINKNYLLIVWLLTPVILPFLISKLSSPIYLTRLLIGSSLPFYILIANGIENIRNRYLKIITINLIIAFSMVSVTGYYKVSKEPWREVANIIETNAKPGDLLLFDSGAVQEWVFDYYSKRTDLVKKPFAKKSGDIYEENIKDLEQTVEGFVRVWLIRSHSRDYKRLIPNALSESYFVKYHNESVGIEIYLFRKNE